MRASIAVDGAYEAAYPYIKANAAHTSSTSVVFPWKKISAMILASGAQRMLAISLQQKSWYFQGPQTQLVYNYQISKLVWSIWRTCSGYTEYLWKPFWYWFSNTLLSFSSTVSRCAAATCRKTQFSFNCQSAHSKSYFQCFYMEYKEVTGLEWIW